jgi:hypothetical protein
MPEYAGGGDRDAFFAALARVFEEFRPVSEGYGVTDISRFAQMVDGDPKSQVEISRVDADNEGITTLAEFKVVGPLPGLVPEPGECITQVQVIGFDGLPSWECIYYKSA